MLKPNRKVVRKLIFSFKRIVEKIVVKIGISNAVKPDKYIGIALPDKVIAFAQMIDAKEKMAALNRCTVKYSEWNCSLFPVKITEITVIIVNITCLNSRETVTLTPFSAISRIIASLAMLNDIQSSMQDAAIK